MTLCPEHQLRSQMTDEEFWEHVFGPTPEEVASWEEYRWAMDSPDVWVVHCARCCRLVQVDDPHERERDAFCDECVEDTVDLDLVPNDPWDLVQIH